MICERRFVTPSKLKIHLKNVHPGVDLDLVVGPGKSSPGDPPPILPQNSNIEKLPPPQAGIFGEGDPRNSRDSVPFPGIPYNFGKKQ